MYRGHGRAVLSFTMIAASYLLEVNCIQFVCSCSLVPAQDKLLLPGSGSRSQTAFENNQGVVSRDSLQAYRVNAPTLNGQIVAHRPDEIDGSIRRKQIDTAVLRSVRWAP